MRISLNYLIISVFVIVLISCGSEEKNTKKVDLTNEEVLTIIDILPPANNGSSVSNLHISDAGIVYLTWIETLENGSAVLYYSTLDGDNWTESIKIAAGDNWIVNWADFPSLTNFGENSLVVNNLIETDPATFAYDVGLIISNDNGKTWNTAFITPHKDATQTEHGFVSLIPYQNETFIAIWLDGRKYAQDGDEMTLRAAIINKEGKIEQDFVLDERVCDCCATDAVITDEGEVAVVYRNRDENELRDMSIVYFKNGEWTTPKLIAKDNWMIAGCPVNGPAIDASANKLAIAWFTSAKDTPIVKFIYSDYFDSEFSSPIKINTSTPIGRVDICFIDENTAAVSWMEGNEKATYLKVRTVKTNGTGDLGEAITVTKMNDSRSSGFPKMVKTDNQLLFTWTTTDNETTIKTAAVYISALK